MSKFRVAFSHDFLRPDGGPVFPQIDLRRLEREADLEVAYLAPAKVVDAAALAEVDALIIQSPRVARESFHPERRLALIARFGVGYEKVDLEAATEAGVAVAITPDGVRRPVAVSILTLMLALSSRLLELDRITRASQWERAGDYVGTGLVGRTLGSIGIGNIGAELFRLARPLDMAFIAHDPFVDPNLIGDLGVHMVDLDTLFAESDVLSVNCPLTPETRGLVSAERLSQMKPGAFLINTSRGPVVDQEALVAALRERRIAGAGLDVFDPEPPAPDDPLLALDNVVLAPHALCESDQMIAVTGALDIEAALEVMHGRAPDHVVNRQVLESQDFRAKLARFAARFGA
jgi:phosphoglycerate dehydrogenase-like enzyme